MLWIGIYVAISSLICDITMVADLIHGFRNKKFWFPCKYFSLNASYIAVITVAMKLPMDLNTELPMVDKAAKPLSLAFMCTIMANLMPSLATMDNMTLLSNVIGLSILIVTIIVDISIYIHSVVINKTDFSVCIIGTCLFEFTTITYIYTTMMLLLLIIMIAYSLTIPTSKEFLEVNYLATNKTFSTDQHLQNTQMSKNEKVRQTLKRYWIMAETASSELVMASNPLSIASGVICVCVLIINLPVFISQITRYAEVAYYSESEYDQSIVLIFVTQSIGVVISAIAPILRSFSLLSFNLVSSQTHLSVFKVEEYWSQTLHGWKQNPIRFLSSNRSRTLAYKSKNAIISLSIILQKVIVILCKMISLILTIIPIFVVYWWKKARLVTPPVVSITDNTDGNLSSYVLKFQDEVELGEKTVRRISNFVNSFFLNAEKEQSMDLLELLEKSTGFQAVENFDTDRVQPLLSVEIVNSWSLPIVTLTSIAIALPNIPNDIIKSLIISVGEGLSYTHQVEEALNCEKEYVNIRKATIILWNEVEHQRKWLDKALGKGGFKGKTTTEILTWFSDRAQETVKDINRNVIGEMVNTPKELIASNSMYRIAETILLRDESNAIPMTKKKLFALLSGMIADIFSDCFTNILQAVTMKCQEQMIEKREASVKVAAKLLGKTTKIIERPDTCELPRMDPDKKAYIDEWRLYFKQSAP